MAGGKGTRMRSSKPKALHCVAGVPMVRYAVSAAAEAAVALAVIVVSPTNRDAIAEELGDEVAYAEQPVPLGTGSALAVALERVPFGIRHAVVMNADLPLVTGASVAALVERHVSRGAAMTLLSAMLPATECGAEMGRLHRGARGKLVAVIEAAESKLSPPAPFEANVGVYAFDLTWVRGAVAELPLHETGEQYITDLVAMAVADGQRVETVPVSSQGEHLGVNTRAELAGAERAMQWRLREAAMLEGVTMDDPSTVYLDAAVVFEPDAVVHANTSIRGRSHICANASIGPNARLRDAVVGEGAVVDAAVVEGTTLAAGAHVGPFSHVRAGSFLDEGVYVGTHVEVKASRLGRGSHVGHFSYVGDAVVGADVNVGAGTVTCNYDGVTKHVTEIEDAAFIGSDTLLIAPVRIGARAVTGAGSVVTRDVAPGERVAGVPARRMEGQKRRAVAIESEGGQTLG